jgi:hypothetical protein
MDNERREALEWLAVVLLRSKRLGGPRKQNTFTMMRARTASDSVVTQPLQLLAA